MIDPVRAAAEAHLRALGEWMVMSFHDEARFQAMCATRDALRAALAAPPQRDERAEAAVALCEADDEVRRWTQGLRVSKCPVQMGAVNRKRLEAIACRKAARRRWAEVDGRTT